MIKKATAYPGVLETLQENSFEITGAAVQQDGRVFTSRGPGTAMDFTLALISHLMGEAKSQQVEAALQREA